MISKKNKIKIISLAVFAGVSVFVILLGNYSTERILASSSGPFPGVSGAPDEPNCTVCHTAETGSGQFTITAPATYTPGQTYQITVQHQTADTTRKRWGFELTALAGTTPASVFSNINTNTQIVPGANGRSYIEHTSAGTFPNTTGGASWTFNWTAPATNVGPVTFYAAGNQANNDNTSDGDYLLTTNTTIQPATVPARPTDFDFDGDHKTDIGIFRPGPGEWWYSRSSDTQTRAAQFGAGTDLITPGDFTGDGKTDIAFFRPSTGEWFLLRSEDGSFLSFTFGSPGDVPFAADFDADAKADPGVYRPSTNEWFVLKSTGGVIITTFGTAGDVPVVADYDGDGKADIAIYRPGPGQWWISRSGSNTVVAAAFGISSDRPVPGDYTGDGKADIGFFRPSTGEWFILRSEDGSFFSVPFGASGDVPVAGDYDGDGKFDTAVFRPSSSTWFVNRTTAGILIAGFGIAGDRPVPAAFIR